MTDEMKLERARRRGAERRERVAAQRRFRAGAGARPAPAETPAKHVPMDTHRPGVLALTLFYGLRRRVRLTYS